MDETPPVQGQPQAPEKDNPIERRISQLVAQRKEAEERAAALTANTSELQEQVLRLTEELAAVKSTPSAPKPEPLAGQSSGVDVAKVIDERLTAWTKSLEERERGQRAIAMLQQAQVASAHQAATEFPEVADKNSQLFQVADRLFKNMPELQRAPNGPYQAIIMARGLLVDAKGDAAPDPRKQAASTGPMGAVGAPALSGSAAKQEVEKLLAARKEVLEKLHYNEGDTTNNYVQQRHIEARLRELGCSEY